MTKLKEMFPNHKLGDKHDFELQQFTADDMVEFALEVAKEALKKASENVKLEWQYFQYEDASTFIDKQSILDESNIPEL